MKIGTIATPNKKGQVVIPKKMRDALGLNVDMPINLVLRDNGIYLYPVGEVINKVKSEDSYLKILSKTQGAWRGESWHKVRSQRKKLELKASNMRKPLW